VAGEDLRETSFQINKPMPAAQKRKHAQHSKKCLDEIPAADI